MTEQKRQQAKPLAIEADWKKLRLTELHAQVLQIDESAWVTYVDELRRLASGFGIEREAAMAIAEHLPALHFDDLNREGAWRVNIGFANVLWSAIAEREGRPRTELVN